MEMNIGFLIILLAAAALVHSQSHIGFISIDCGSVQEQYTDSNTNISYVSDKNFEETGINRNISPEYAYPINPNLPQLLQDLRSFPQGSKNCYSLNPVRNGSLNLIRATFLYGNYDGLNKQPKFDLYVEVNLWSAIKVSNVSDVVTTEIITTAMSDTIHVCLVNKGLGVPFISALELRPVDSSMYDTEFIRTTSASLLLFKRLDIGHINGTDKKYQDDMYDRIWTSYMNTAIWDSLSTSQQINTVGNGNNVPSQVIMTAAKPQNGTTSFLFNWSANDSSSEFYIYMYFAELEQLNGKNQSRKFTVSWNGAPMFGTISPRYLFATTISSSGAVAGNKHVIYFYQTEDSTHPPILNALEIYLVKHMDESPTYSQDVNAIGKVKVTYQISKNWAGDPCSGPKNLFWEGLKCSYNTSVPRIISLNLTSSNLSGIIAASIKELSSLEFLDLSNNSLTGSIPEFLEDMKSLKSINLKGNQLSGKIPNALVKRWEAGLLTLSVDTQHLCDSGSCKKNNKIIVPVVASLSSAAVILILFVLGWILGRKGKTRDDIHPCEITCNEVQLRYFNYNGLNFLIMFNVNCQTLNIGNYHSDGLKTFAIFEANGVHVKLVEYELLGLQPSPFHCQ